MAVSKQICRTKTFLIQRLWSRTLAKVICNKLVLAFVLGMLCLELISNFVMDIEWPSESDTDPLVYPADLEREVSDLGDVINSTEAGNGVRTVAFFKNLSSDDLLDIQEGRKSSQDPYLLEYIRRQIWLPSKRPLNLTSAGRRDPSQAGQAVFVDTILGGIRDGFFVECGAGNGEEFSDTLFLERERDWTGLLMEPHPAEFQRLLFKRRRAWSLQACASPSASSDVRVLRAARGYVSGLSGYVDQVHAGKDFRLHPFYQGDIRVQCFPLAAVLRALGRDHVDYLSLDVEGAELDILAAFPFADIRVNVVSVEYAAQGAAGDREVRSLRRLQQIRHLMAASELYREVGVLVEPHLAGLDTASRDRHGLDVVFIRRDYAAGKVADPASLNRRQAGTL